jgi:hypothetical protein
MDAARKDSAPRLLNCESDRERRLMDRADAGSKASAPNSAGFCPGAAKDIDEAIERQTEFSG